MSSLAEFLSNIFRMFKWWVTISPWERSVRVRAGKYVKLCGPGIHLAVPYVDRFYTQSIRRRVTNLNNQTLTTQDKKVVFLGAVLGYEILDLEKLYQTLHHAEATLHNTAAGAIAQYVATHTAEECTPLRVAEEAAKSLNFEKYGIGNVSLQIDEFSFMPKTLRIVTGMGDRWSTGDRLDTETWTES